MQKGIVPNKITPIIPPIKNITFYLLLLSSSLLLYIIILIKVTNKEGDVDNRDKELKDLRDIMRR